MSDAPTCQVCNRTGKGVQFPIFPKAKGYSFGEICADCEHKLITEKVD